MLVCIYKKGGAMKRTAAEAAETRRALLRAALGVFSQRGYSATTLEQVARAAGVTRGAVYWHFESKAALYRALLQEYGDRAGPIMQRAAAEGGDFLAICGRILAHLLASLEEDPELRAVMELTLFQTERSDELAEVFADRNAATQALVAQLTEIMRQGVAAGAVRAECDPADVARGFLAYQQGLFALWLVDPESFSLRERASALADLFIKGISA
jgi:TetR/AcrR family transcriptional regulator, acrAB operon repressor